MTIKNSDKSFVLLESISSKKLATGSFLFAIREGQALTQVAFAKKTADISLIYF